ncbi:PDR/VanB family oxidoreductase [Pseudolysinimonas sp.]|jgi:ferredoxin-NADP reductase|uniref:PDR/VanB family oxidoreductase n=1 Tax=Pseudolysinimonas sp. TaxID=2680009 RepID=UPI003784CEB6
MIASHSETRLRVADRATVAEGVVELTLERPEGGRLPDWTPGAHIDLVLADGTTRQYSLCGHPSVSHEYRVSVLRDDEGRGGSSYIHDYLQIGDLVGFGGPRNNFALVPSPRYRFIAGGIGITPILPMVSAAVELGSDISLLYLGRRRATMAHLDALAGLGGRLEAHPADEFGRLDLEAWLGDFDPDVKVYVCGPERLLDEVERLTAAWRPGWVRMERFAAKDAGQPARATAYQVEAAASGVTVTLQPDQNVADALRAAGVELLTSCSQGVCGTCETDVLSGVPDHRDSILDTEERSSNACMFPCVSRSRSDLLVLDL